MEVGAIVYWACINRRRAEELVDNIVSWRDVSMHCYQAPNPAADVGEHPRLHFDRVSEFYGEHPWLGEKVPWSFGEELAMSRLLSWCGLMVERPAIEGSHMLDLTPSQSQRHAAMSTTLSRLEPHPVLNQ